MGEKKADGKRAATAAFKYLNGMVEVENTHFCVRDENYTEVSLFTVDKEKKIGGKKTPRCGQKAEKYI